MTADGKPEGWAGRDRNLRANSVIEAIDYNTGKVRWEHEIGDGEGSTGILTTEASFCLLPIILTIYWPWIRRREKLSGT